MKRRYPRASAEDIWRHCRQYGDCPDDVQKKFTGNTIADNILKWASSVLFFGGLGIGTAEGAASAADRLLPTGGGFGTPQERPFETTVTRLPDSNATPGTSVTAIEPAVVLDSGSVVRGADPVNPTNAAPPRVHGGINETEVFPPPTTIETPVWRNPFENATEYPTRNVGAVDSTTTNEIELGVVGPAARDLGNAVEETEFFSTFDIEEPTTSTPIGTGRWTWSASARFQRAAAREVPLPVLTSSGRVVQFENPAFDFSEAVDDFSRSIQFDDASRLPIARLSGPRFYLQQTGRIGVQRVGELWGNILRSGRQLLAPRVYYAELSSIFTSPDTLEMEPLYISTDAEAADVDAVPAEVDVAPGTADTSMPGTSPGVFPTAARAVVYNGLVVGTVPVDVSIKARAGGFIPMPHDFDGSPLIPLFPSFDKVHPAYSVTFSMLSELDDPVLTKKRKKCFADGCLDTFY
uniref:L2 capsid protein n=1 Tax=Chelonia mydas papillomavirus 1 TaxID=485242 RepID=A0A6M6CDB7_9PAPI|nr:L2 capsid protein [Chelonia mydas papillomavirus 1]QJX58445.1 L2 capsid protein [Chelonia mydas papillomavirus 1]